MKIKRRQELFPSPSFFSSSLSSRARAPRRNASLPRATSASSSSHFSQAEVAPPRSSGITRQGSDRAAILSPLSSSRHQAEEKKRNGEEGASRGRDNERSSSLSFGFSGVHTAHFCASFSFLSSPRWRRRKTKNRGDKSVYTNRCRPESRRHRRARPSMDRPTQPCSRGRNANLAAAAAVGISELPGGRRVCRAR